MAPSQPLLGGAAFLLLVCALPSLVTLPLQLHAVRAGAPVSSTTFAGILVGSMLVGLLLVPLYAGYLQTIDAVARGLPARASDVFQPYRRGQVIGLIGYGLAMMVVYVVLFGGVVAATGGHLAHWYVQTLAAQANHQPPPLLPGGIGTVFALLTVLGLFMMGFYAISLGQVALRGRSVPAAIGDGLVGALKNVLPLLVFMLSLIVFLLVMGIVLAVVAALLALVARLTSPWLVIALAVPLYLMLVLTLCTVLYGAMYYLWRDVCGDDPVAAIGPAVTA